MGKELIALDAAGAAQQLRRIPTAVDNMDGRNPFLHTLASLPVAPEVVVNSIIPVEGDGDFRTGDDGVVRYGSAHIDDVESELVVRSGHSCQANPHTIEEVRRILYVHSDLN